MTAAEAARRAHRQSEAPRQDKAHKDSFYNENQLGVNSAYLTLESQFATVEVCEGAVFFLSPEGQPCAPSCALLATVKTHWRGKKPTPTPPPCLC